MKKYDLIIIGGGGGLKLRPAADLGKKIAIIEKEDLGGTCLNRGCIPSKMLIHTADVIDQIREAEKFNIKVSQKIKVEFKKLIERVNSEVSKSSKSIEENYAKHPNIDFYHKEARFINDKIITVGKEKITAEKILIATGTRPHIPDIPGLIGTPFMTSREALKVKKLPKKMIVIGGGYIATELGNFFGALGTEVHFLIRSEVLKFEDKDIRAEFYRKFSEKYHLHIHTTPKKISYKNKNFRVETINKNNSLQTLIADSLLVATGITPNSDNLGLENTAIKLDTNGYIQVDDYLQTSVKNIYAIGDVIGRNFFRHSVNFEGEYLFDTLFEKPRKEKIEYPPMPHAVFANPQVAGVGVTEDELIKKGQKAGTDYFTGKNPYAKSAMGDALRSDHGLTKLIFETKSEKLIGGHIVGPEASDMIHMIIAYINMGATLKDMLRTIYIHPALPENIRNAARDAKNNLQNLSN